MNLAGWPDPVLLARAIRLWAVARWRRLRGWRGPRRPFTVVEQPPGEPFLPWDVAAETREFTLIVKLDAATTLGRRRPSREFGEHLRL